MRNLVFDDVFKMSEIMKKIKLKDDLDIAGMTVDEAGQELIMVIMENIHLARKEINEFMGGLNEMSAEEFSKLSLDQAMSCFNELKNQPGIQTFFKSASRLMK